MGCVYLKKLSCLFFGSFVLLAGCSSVAGTDSEQPKAPPKELTIIMPDDTSQLAKHRIETFQKHGISFEAANPGVKVTVVTLPKKDYAVEIQTRLNEQKPMDLLFTHYDLLAADPALAADLTPLFKADRLTTDNLFKPLVEMVTLNGKMTAIPMSPQPLALYYNKEWFRKANVADPADGWTWEQFFSVSAKLKEANGMAGKDIYGSAVPVDAPFMETLAQSNGSSVLSPDGSKLSGYLDSAKVAQAFSMLLKDLNSGKAIRAVGNGGDPINAGLASGYIGMGVGVYGIYPYMIQNPKLQGNIAVAPMPRMENGVRANAVYIEALAVASASKQQALAWKFVKDVVLNADHEFQTDWSKRDLLTLRTAVRKQTADPHTNVFYNELNYAVKPLLYVNPRLRNVMATDFTKKLMAVQSEADVQRVLTEAAFDMDKRLAEVKL